MPAPTIAPAAVQAPALDLEARLALVGALVQQRLDEAAVAFEVNTAHIPVEPVDFTAPAITPTIAPALTPIAACLQQAARILTERGWTRGHLRGEQGAVCAVGAIRAAATSRGQADDACALLLDVIQQEFAGAETVPSWNDQQTSATPVIRILGQAADHA